MAEAPSGTRSPTCRPAGGRRAVLAPPRGTPIVPAACVVVVVDPCHLATTRRREPARRTAAGSRHSGERDGRSEGTAAACPQRLLPPHSAGLAARKKRPPLPPQTPWSTHGVSAHLSSYSTDRHTSRTHTRASERGRGREEQCFTSSSSRKPSKKKPSSPFVSVRTARSKGMRKFTTIWPSSVYPSLRMSLSELTLWPKVPVDRPGGRAPYIRIIAKKAGRGEFRLPEKEHAAE